MKVLLFTHSVDIDGMGSAVLANLAFNDPKIEYCDTFEINQKVQNYLKNNEIYTYDMIFVADLCIKQPLLGEIANNERLNQKVQILDHHKSEIEEGNGNFPFSHIVVENEKGKCSGTSLFYEYLLINGYINRTNIIDDFVDLTRQYDTWEWKTKYNNERANELNIVFSIYGIQKYVELFSEKLKRDEYLFDDVLKREILNRKNEIEEISLNHIRDMNVLNLHGYKIGVIKHVKDEHKNDIAEMLKKDGFPKIDLVAMEIYERRTISLRSIDASVDVGVLAARYDGKGHKNAGSFKITEQVKLDFCL